MGNEINLTRAELQEEWDKSCALVARLTEACKTLATERDEARKQRDEIKAKAANVWLRLSAICGDMDIFFSSVDKSVTNPSK